MGDIVVRDVEDVENISASGGANQGQESAHLLRRGIPLGLLRICPGQEINDSLELRMLWFGTCRFLNPNAFAPFNHLSSHLSRTSESKGHEQTYDSSAAFDLKFLYGLAATSAGTSNRRHRPVRLSRPHHIARLTTLCVHRIPRPTFGNDWPNAPLHRGGMSGSLT